MDDVDLRRSNGELAATRRFRQRVFWVGLYVVLALLPLAVALIGPVQPRRDFWTEFSVGLGFVGLAMIGMQFAITARFRRVEAPYGLDIVLLFHRQISLLAVGLILVHPVILFAVQPDARAMILSPLSAPARAWFAVIALTALMALVVLSLWRKRFRQSYEGWRVTHGVLAVAAAAFALAHVVGVAHYTAQPWKQLLWSGAELAVVGLLVYTRVVKPFRLGYYPYRVQAVRPERGGACTLELLPDGHAGIRFEPGQFAWIKVGHTPFSAHENPFSFSGSAARPGVLEFTIKPCGDFTRSAKDIQPGTRVYVDGPYGVFTAHHQPARAYAYVAGGIGITPIMSILRTHADRGDTRSHLLIDANSSYDSITFREELEALEKRLSLKVVHVLERVEPGIAAEQGFVTAEILDRYLPTDRNAGEVFVCGPPRMLEAVGRALVKAGVAPDNIHTELFNLL
jgi:3-phenylpropionate/trans-cinnamate dioxygenase ferredoxin reductase subunit